MLFYITVVLLDIKILFTNEETQSFEVQVTVVCGFGSQNHFRIW